MVKMTKKGQNALPVILLAMAGLMLFYLIMVHPMERAKILEPINGELVEEAEGLIFSSGRIVEVGQATGETVFGYNMGNVYVAYPVVERTLSSTQINPSASIFRNDVNIFNVDIDTENTKEVVLILNTTEIRGSPSISVFINETRIFEQRLSLGETEVTIPARLLEEDKSIKLSFNHDGYFWSRPSAEIELEIVRAYYSAEKPTETRIIPLSEGNIMGTEIHLSFFVEEAIPEGEFIVKINDVILHSETFESEGVIILKERIDDSGIKVGDNRFVFEADRGGVYNLTNFRMEFIAADTPPSQHVYSFNIEKEDLESFEDIVLGIKINRIIKPGYVSVQIGTDGPIHYLSQEELVAGSWSYITLNRYYLRELDNKITVSSPTGRYRLDGFMVFLR